MVMIEAILCAGIATQPRGMASISASAPAGAWEISSTRIAPFISKPNEHRSSGGGLRWVAAFMRLQHNGFHDMHQQVLTCWWQGHYPNWLSPFTRV